MAWAGATTDDLTIGRPHRRFGIPLRSARPQPGPVDTIIVKLAARCNLACGYCYWFRDATVMNAPRRLTEAAEEAFLARLRTHLGNHALERMVLVLHGGEPMLFGKRRFAGLCAGIREVEQATGVPISIDITTNGVLVDDEWAALCRWFGVNVTVSIDGPASVHDANRPDLQGRPTHARVVAGIETLRSFGIEPGILAVCDPTSSPLDLLRHLVDELGCVELDVLIPDATHDDPAPAIGAVGRWYRSLFDVWWESYAVSGVHIRFIDAAIRALSGSWSGVESIGYGPVGAVTLCTDGSIEVHDVVRIVGDGSTASPVNVLTHELDDIRQDPLWQELWSSSLDLAPDCRACPWHDACGGGHIASRWSSARRFDNPNVYCLDLQAILGHIWERIAPTLTVVAVADA
jgi:uncharacterized protein